jgi:Flp pilus assembly protein TadD
VAKSPENPTYHYHLGVAYQRAKDPAAAATQFRQVLKLDPGYEKSQEIRKQLDELVKG